MEAKIEQLIAVNEELEKKQAVYIAKKDCRIDKALERYINTRFPEKTERLQIMFIRESEGVYQFGQKRVHIKIEKGDSIYVRVGGGYLHIDEFIKEFTTNEQERIERRDVLARFHNKMAI